MPPAPLPSNEQERLAALAACGVLDTAPEEAFDGLTRLAASIAGTPVALVSLVDEGRQWFKSSVGLDASETPRDQAFCAYAIESDRPLIIPDATFDERTRDNPLVTGEPRIRRYAGIPLKLSDGYRVGTLCVIGFEPGDFSFETIGALTVLAMQASTQLELRRRTRQLAEAGSKAASSAQVKEQFFADMSHEIRTPVAAIVGHADLLRDAIDDGAGSDELVSHADRIKDSGHHLLALINDILDVARIEAGEVTIDHKPESVASMLGAIHSEMEPLAAPKRVGLAVALDPSMPASVRIDGPRVRQILMNLVGNAVKFTDGGWVRVRAAYDRKAGVLEVSVKDTGIGMPTEAIEKIRRFEPFTQADDAFTRRFGGTGLGLAISNSLAAMMGGAIRVESEEGRGSEFTLVLPAPALEVQTEVPTASARRAPGSPRARTGASLDGMHLLLAEDGLDNQRLIGHLLRREGAEVQIVENGQLAMDAIERERYDLLLLDMQMPVCDGYTAARTLRERGSSIPIVAVTAHALPGDREKCLDAGCDDYMTKPVDASLLVEMCRRYGTGAAA